MARKITSWVTPVLALTALAVTVPAFGAGPAVATPPTSPASATATHVEGRTVTVVAAMGADLRVRPRKHARVAAHLEAGATVTVVGTAVQSDGHLWLKTGAGLWVWACAVAALS